MSAGYYGITGQEYDSGYNMTSKGSVTVKAVKEEVKQIREVATEMLHSKDKSEKKAARQLYVGTEDCIRGTDPITTNTAKAAITTAEFLNESVNFTDPSIVDEVQQKLGETPAYVTGQNSYNLTLR